MPNKIVTILGKNSMEAPFTYNSLALDNQFLSRKKELNQLINILKERKNALIYEPYRTGKRSLINMALKGLAKENIPYRLCHIDMLNITQSKELFSILEKHPTQDDVYTIYWIEEFQNILRFEDYDKTLLQLEKHWENDCQNSYILSGSMVNAMKYIFEDKKYFYHFADVVKFTPIEEKAATDMIIKTFLKVGRVVEHKHAERMYETVDGHPWYLWQISNTAFHLTKGYINDKLIDESIDSLLIVYDVKFRETINSLSNYQISLLRAIFDGETKLSSVECIEKYHLNSSANVKRLKEALTKKEVVAFNEQDIPYIIDPLFRLWLKRFFFKETI